AARQQRGKRIDIAADPAVASAGRRLHNLDLAIWRKAQKQHDVRAGLVEGVAGLQIPRIGEFGRDRRNGGGGDVMREPPSGAHECGAIDAGDIGAWIVMCTHIAGQHAVRDPGAKLIERAVASPAVRHAAYLLIEPAAEVAWAPDAIKSGTCRVRV